MKAITWKYLIRGRTLQALQRYQVRLIEEVFHLLARAGHATRKRRSNAPVQIPPNFIDLLKAAPESGDKTLVDVGVMCLLTAPIGGVAARDAALNRAAGPNG